MPYLPPPQRAVISLRIGVRSVLLSVAVKRIALTAFNAQPLKADDGLAFTTFTSNVRPRRHGCHSLYACGRYPSARHHGLFRFTATVTAK